MRGVSTFRNYGNIVLWSCNVTLHTFQPVDCDSGDHATDYEDTGFHSGNMCFCLLGIGNIQVNF